MNRRTFLKGSLGLAGLALTAPYVARGAAAPLTLRFAHFAQEDHPANIAAKQFASRVEARTGGHDDRRALRIPSRFVGAHPLHPHRAPGCLREDRGIARRVVAAGAAV
jgi:hypothetical protein